MGRPTELIIGPTELDLGPQKNRRFKASRFGAFWWVRIGKMILVDVKSRTIFLVPSFRRFIFFHTKKLGGFWCFFRCCCFFGWFPWKTRGFPAGFSDTDAEEVILGTVSLGPPDPRIASDAFLVPFGVAFQGGTWTSQSLNDGGLIRPESWDFVH